MSSKRRSFDPEFKLKCVLDVLSGRQTPAQVCREHGLNESNVGPPTAGDESSALA